MRHGHAGIFAIRYLTLRAPFIHLFRIRPARIFHSGTKLPISVIKHRTISAAEFLHPSPALYTGVQLEHFQEIR